MKTFLAIIGTLALLVVILIGALFVVGFQRAMPILEEAHAFADESIPAIAENWDGDELSSRASPELAEILKNGVVEELMTTASFQLGAMTAYNGAACEMTRYEINTGSGEFILSECAATAEFQKANASFRLSILKRDSEWKILGFYVTPEPTGDQPVQVAYTPNETDGIHKMELSISRMSIGVSSRSAEHPGVGIRTNDKIDNLN